MSTPSDPLFTAYVGCAFTNNSSSIQISAPLLRQVRITQLTTPAMACGLIKLLLKMLRLWAMVQQALQIVLCIRLMLMVLFMRDLTITASGGTPGPGNSKGLFTGDRPSSATLVQYFNGSSLVSLASTSHGVTNATFTIGQSQGFLAQGEPAPRVPTNQTLSAAFIGASLGAAGQLALYNRLRTYMTAVGVP